MGNKTEQTSREKIVLEYLSGGITYRQLEKKYGIEHSTIHRWVLIHKGIPRDRAKEYQSKKSAISEVPPDTPTHTTVFVENPVNEKLKIQLNEAELKIALLQEIISIAEKDLGLVVPKKSITKLSKLSGKNKN
jgi:transposase-like protein